MTNTHIKECTCYWPDLILSIPDGPACIDAQTKEFRWYNQGKDTKGYMTFKFCPSCGYKMPRKEREYVQEGITKDEYLRLVDLIKPITNINTIHDVLGETEHIKKQVVYSKLSEAVSIEVIAEKENNDTWETHINFKPKMKDSK